MPASIEILIQLIVCLSVCFLTLDSSGRIHGAPSAAPEKLSAAPESGRNGDWWGAAREASDFVARMSEENRERVEQDGGAGSVDCQWEAGCGEGGIGEDTEQRKISASTRLFLT